MDLLLPQRRSPPFLRHPPLEVRQHPRVGVFVGSRGTQSHSETVLKHATTPTKSLKTPEKTAYFPSKS